MGISLLTESSAKLSKSQNDEWLNAVMYLEPSVDYGTMCAGSTEGCRPSCLVYSGMMRMEKQKNARVARTQLYLNHSDDFMDQLIREIEKLQRKAVRLQKRLALRLNGTSDIDWSYIYEMFPDVQFYEYTKRMPLARAMKKYSNVHMTFSRNEKTKTSTLKKLLDKGINVAVVFASDVPESFKQLPVVDGDKHDRRFEDPTGSIIGLKLKGTIKAKQHAIESGFAITNL